LFTVTGQARLLVVLQAVVAAEQRLVEMTVRSAVVLTVAAKLVEAVVEVEKWVVVGSAVETVRNSCHSNSIHSHSLFHLRIRQYRYHPVFRTRTLHSPN